MWQKLIDRLTRYLTIPAVAPTTTAGLEHHWTEVAQPGDVLLVEGVARISLAIKYLTQSTWSHAALVVGDLVPDGPLIEADLAEGVIACSFDKYRNANVRICRPRGLRDDEIARLARFAHDHLGTQYDVKNIRDLIRYLLPTPPVPQAYRRRMLTLGSGDPTEKLICSSLIARAFQHVHYPILPIQWWQPDASGREREVVSQVRHYSLFVPRDFDLSPYFDVVKPTLTSTFDFHAMHWEAPEHMSECAASEPR